MVTPAAPDDVLELEVGAIAAGGGCVGRAPDGRVVFVRHSLPGERVRARVTSEASSFLRADAVEVLVASPDRVDPACPLAGPGRCGGCDFQHVALPAQRRLKEDLVAEQLSRLARVDLRVPVEEVAGSPDGLAWRTRVGFAVDPDGTVGLRRHRSHEIEPVERCPIATDGVNGARVASVSWKGARQLEVLASPDGGTPVVLVDTGKDRIDGLPALDIGLVWKGRTLRAPDHVTFEVDGNRFEVGAGVFWQVHPQAPATLTRAVLDGLAPRRGERAADLYAGAGLFTVALARAVGPSGSVVAVERSGPAVADRAGRGDAGGGRPPARSAGPGRARPGPRRGRQGRDGGAGRPRAGTAAYGLRVLRAGTLRPRPGGGSRGRLAAGIAAGVRPVPDDRARGTRRRVGAAGPLSVAPRRRRSAGRRRRGPDRRRWYARHVRGRPLALLLAVGLVATGCSGGTSSTSAAPTTSLAPKPAGATPSPISVQVCSAEAQKDMASALGERASVSTPTWVDHRYACTYDYPGADPTGSFEVSVKELSSWAETTTYYDGLAAQLGNTRNLESLGQGAFQTTDGSVVVRKDWKVLLVDDSALPTQFGVPPTSASDIAVTVADVILGCWAGD